jgi:hypothetical protein
MIQRVQSILLLLITVCSVCLLFLPFVSYENLFNTFTLRDFKKPYCGTWYYAAETLNFLVIGISFCTIFLFKKRMLQFKMANTTGLLSVCLQLILLIAPVANIEVFLSGAKHILWPSYLPVASIILSFTAAAFIKKDENLVRSADRIR